MSKVSPRNVLVTGANGFIGNSVARAFVRAGWNTYGLVRSASATKQLAIDEIIPVLGSAADLSFLRTLHAKTRTFQVIVSVTANDFDYLPHFNEVINLLRTLAKTSNDNGIRPLVLFTSGCKDYGMTGVAGSQGLLPHTEESPLNAPQVLDHRAKCAMKVFDHDDLFDAVVFRPSTLYGRSGSYYGPFFDIAARAAAKGVFDLPGDPSSILHGTHIDDCGDAYVAIAEHPHREVVKGQCYNISGHRYETLHEVAEALVKEYAISGGVKYWPPPDESAGLDMVQVLIGFSQWVGSEKLRSDVGWKDKRLLFSQGLHAYRIAYEAAAGEGHSNVQKIQGLHRMTESAKRHRKV